MNPILLERVRRRDHGYRDARAFLTPGQTLLVFVLGAFLLCVLCTVIVQHIFAQEAEEEGQAATMPMDVNWIRKKPPSSSIKLRPM